jgi:transposase
LENKATDLVLNNIKTDDVTLLIQLFEKQNKIIEDSKEQLIKKDQTIEALTNQITLLNEKLDYFTRKFFGSSKETLSEEVSGQLSLDLFEESSSSLPVEEEETEVKAHTRKKKGTKAKKLADLPQKEVHHELSEDERQCPKCGHLMIDMGTRKIRDEIAFHQAKLESLQHIQHSYCCKDCERLGDTSIRKAVVPKPLINNSLGSSSIVAETIRQKFEMNTPAYRQIKYWESLGLDITRENIVNWHSLVSHEYLSLLVDRFHQCLLEEDVAYADETPYRVIRSSNKKTYYWVFSSLKMIEHPVVIYHHDESRSHEVPQQFFKGFGGYLHCDGYSGYDTLPDVLPVRCLAHVRRKFFEAIPQKKGKKESLAAQVVQQMKKLFDLEKKWISLSPDERVMKRRLELRPAFNQVYDLIGTISAVPKSKLEKAVHYACKYRGDLERVFEDGRLELTNNQSERYVKQLVMTRKNCLFSTSLKGAQASGHILSVIETAKTNGLNSTKYLEYLFNELPNLPVLTPEVLDAYLPWSEKVQNKCKLI